MGLMSALNIVAVIAHAPMADDGLLGLLNLIVLLVVWGAWNGAMLWRHQTP